MQQPDWSREFRSLMPVAQRWAYFDHAAVAPLPQPGLDRITEWATDMANNGDANWFRWRKQVEHTRSLFAEILSASGDEIAIIRNTTEGINLIAEGFPWEEGDNVVTLDSEFPSNLYPWMNLHSRGVETRLVPCSGEQPDQARLVSLCDSRTRILSVSWTGFVSGWRNDLSQLCDFAHQRGILLFVDAIQALGVIPLDVQKVPVDFLAADGHKWLLGPEAAGVLFVRREHLPTLRPLMVGWNSMEHAGNFADHSFRLKPGANRYEGGTYCLGNVAALGASLELFQRYTISAVSNQLREVTDELITRLKNIGAEILSDRSEAHWSGIVSFRPGDAPLSQVKEKCLEREILLNVRGKGIRLSPHAYTNEEDIDRLIDVLRTL